MIPDQNQNIPEKKIEQVEVSQPTPTEQSPPIKSEENQANWKAFREQRETERKAREEAEKRARDKAEEAEALKAALEALTNKSATRQQENDDIEESEEARIDKRVDILLKQREKAAYEARRQQEQQELPQKLQRTYGDFEKICTTENLDYLEYHYPEVAEPFKHIPEGFDKWSAIYKAVKRFVPNSDLKNENAKIDRNLTKPSSISSTGTTQGSGSMPMARLDESRKASNWERMQKLLKGLS